MVQYSASLLQMKTKNFYKSPPFFANRRTIYQFYNFGGADGFLVGAYLVLLVLGDVGGGRKKSD